MLTNVLTIKFYVKIKWKKWKNILKYNNEGKKEIKIKCIRPLFNMSYMFCDCSSLTSLNL